MSSATVKLVSRTRAEWLVEEPRAAGKSAQLPRTVIERYWRVRAEWADVQRILGEAAAYVEDAR